jgi:hypothetical protein
MDAHIHLCDFDPTGANATRFVLARREMEAAEESHGGGYWKIPEALEARRHPGAALRHPQFSQI